MPLPVFTVPETGAIMEEEPLDEWAEDPTALVGYGDGEDMKEAPADEAHRSLSS